MYEKKWQFLEFAHKHAVTLKPDNYEYDFGVVISGGRQVLLFSVMTRCSCTYVLYRSSRINRRSRKCARFLSAEGRNRPAEIFTEHCCEKGATLTQGLFFWRLMVDFVITALENCQNPKCRGFGVITDYGNNIPQISLRTLSLTVKSLWKIFGRTKSNIVSAFLIRPSFSEALSLSTSSCYRFSRALLLARSRAV